MDVWTTRSNPRAQTLAAAATAAVGLLLVVACRGFRDADSNVTAGFFLGVLLLAVGAGGFLASGPQTVTIDPDTRRITVEDDTRLRTTRRTIHFDEVVDVGIGYVGRRSSHVGWYHLVLTLRGGGRYALFAPGRFFPGTTDRGRVAGWKDRLERELGLAADDPA